MKNVTDYSKESKSELIDLRRRYYGKLKYELMDLNIEKVLD